MTAAKRRYKTGEKITYKIVGAGVTSYERDEVVELKNGRLFTESYSSEGMGWSESEQTWVFSSMGLVASIVPNDDAEALEKLGPLELPKAKTAKSKAKAAKPAKTAKKPKQSKPKK